MLHPPFYLLRIVIILEAQLRQTLHTIVRFQSLEDRLVALQAAAVRHSLDPLVGELVINLSTATCHHGRLTRSIPYSASPVGKRPSASCPRQAPHTWFRQVGLEIAPQEVTQHSVRHNEALPISLESETCTPVRMSHARVP